MKGIDKSLEAERDRLIGEHVTARPAWWRIFARRRWRRRLAELRAMDCSFFAAMLRRAYTPDSVERLAGREDMVERFRRVARERIARKDVATEEEADALALETDAKNGSAIYTKFRALRKAYPRTVDRDILRTVETDE